MNVTQPTKKQLAKLISLADAYDETSSYLMLGTGEALAALYRDGETATVIVGRDGRLDEEPGSAVFITGLAA